MDNFVVSARKYRPANFLSVVGQNHISMTLKNAISRNQLAHAYLFCGPRGVGKTTCARIFAKAINCLSPVDNEACNECESCRSFNEGRSFNIHELDAASNNSVDDIRTLTDQVRIPPQIGRYSVYIIDEVHMLSSQAFNAFLKTLEEPPSHAVFILATTEKHKIIPTILSRCQIFDFNRIRVEDSVSYLKYIASQEAITADDESLHLIAQKADGGMRDALSMFDKAVSFCGKELQFKEVAQTLNVLDYDTYFNITQLILAGDYPATLLLFDEVLRKGFSGQTFIGGLNSHFRDILMCKSEQTAPLLEVTGSLLERYKAQGVGCDVGFLFDAIALLTALDGTLRTATNQRLNVELGLMKLCGLGQKKNNPLGNLTVATLPELRREQQPVVTASGDGSQITTVTANIASTTVAPQQATTPQPATYQPSLTPPTLKPAEVSIPVTESAPAATSDPTPTTTTSTQPESRAAIHAMPQSISGKSIASIMSATKSIHDSSDSDDDEQVVVNDNIDPDSQLKISRFRERFMKQLQSDRPRIAMAFMEMQVRDNVISINVPSESLYEDVMRLRTEILTQLASVAGVNGILELNVVVKEDTGVRRPIKVEDKLRFLSEKNPLLTTLRQSMDLDIE